jgi:hypothetical protein
LAQIKALQIGENGSYGYDPFISYPETVSQREILELMVYNTILQKIRIIYAVFLKICELHVDLNK